jgi:hypothetical protein
MANKDDIIWRVSFTAHLASKEDKIKATEQTNKITPKDYGWNEYIHKWQHQECLRYSALEIAQD